MLPGSIPLVQDNESVDNSFNVLFFKDAVGRKFSFPFYLVETWEVSIFFLGKVMTNSRKGMEEFIRQLFDWNVMYSHPLASHVHGHHYDLVGPDGVILPQLWEESIKPNWSVSMHMWPLDGFSLPQFGPPRIVPSPSAHDKLSPPSA
jgi:hypothetical protein